MLLIQKIKEIIKDEYVNGIGQCYSELLEENDLDDFYSACALRIYLYLQGQKEKESNKEP